MKIVKSGPVSRIYADDLKTYDKLPVGNYKIEFSMLQGFYLEDIDSFKLDEKPYGKHPDKIEKAIRLYENNERSVGILLSGKKGMGKSMFSRLLSIAFAERRDMPTIIVTEAYQGIADFIDSIKQECIILFDEFEKVFDNAERKEHQDKLLSLFDGISQTKRLYLITVNELRKVNQYMINRPGRFHYHLQFNHPSVEEIEMYLKDKLKPEFHHQIVLVQRFANRFDLNYDSLRAIAFELNLGYGFLETMEDLNISSTENESVKYDITVHYSNGTTSTTDAHVNLMSSHLSFAHYASRGEDYVSISLSPLEIEIQDKSSFTAKAENLPSLKVSYDSDNTTLKEDEVSVEKIVFVKREWGAGAKYGKELEAVMV